MNESSEYKHFLRAEIKRIEKATRTMWITGAILIVLIIAYMSFVLTMVRTFTEPNNAAFIVSDAIEQNFPEFISSTEELLGIQAVVLAEESSRSFIQAVPKIREEAERQISYAHTDMIPHLSVEFQSMLTDYIQTNMNSVELLAEEARNTEAADAFVSELMIQFGAYLDVQLVESYDGRGLDYFMENSLLALQAMDSYLSELTRTSPEEMSHKQMLQYKILASLAGQLSLVK